MNDRVNILAVDDHPDKLLALEAVLSELGERIVKATSGREALRALLTDEFAVVLLDVNMPGMDGFETASLMRQRKNSEHTPIIFITSYGDETHASYGYSLGAVDYILAPVNPDVLKTKVSVFVELFRKTLQIRQQAQSLEQRTVQLQRLTEASLAINSALSPGEMLRVLTSLARDILAANEATAVAIGEGKSSFLERAMSRSGESDPGAPGLFGEEGALHAFLSQVRGTVRIPRGDRKTGPAWRQLIESDRPARLGWIAAPLSTREGRPIGLLHLMDKREGDFTDEDEAILTQLAQMTSIAIENILNAEAREANRVKDEFLTTLSHELRTPLSAILGWTRTLRGGAEHDRLEHGLEVIERNVRAQTKLIDDLLDVSRIITGKLRLNVRSTPVGPVIDAAIESMRPAADAKDIVIRFDRALPAVDDMLVGDPDRLQQVVWNLVSNAIKFTPRGGRVDVSLSGAQRGFEISVTDTGRGITPEFLPRVFERFRQENSSTTRSHGGLGIGLAIARHLVELHGGTILAESDGPNRGARFTVHLPRVAPEAPAAVSMPGASRPDASSPTVDLDRLDETRVLLVEDELDSRELLEHVLTSAGARVDSAGSVAAALQLFTASAPDVVVSDIGMPVQDGYDLVRCLRRLPASAGGGVPALALTAYAREEDRLRALAAGFDVHVVKPVDPADLVSAIARLVRRPHRPEGPERPEELAKGALARILLVEDDFDSREGLKSLLELWGHAVDIAEDGAQAVERAIQGRPGVALIDIGLPEIDGYEVANRIRQALGADGIYLVALTGHAGEQERQRALANGFDAHVSKPIDFSILSTLLAARSGASVSSPATS